MRGDRVVFAGGDNRLDPALDQKCPHLVAVVSSIANQTLWFAMLALARFNANALQRRVDQGHFRRGSLLHVYSEWSTRAIGQYHELCSLAAFSLPDHGAPFLPGRTSRQ